ncbi:ABC transporter permease [Macrococcus animalis]|uniref:ABC transporter permease n=1 Tax=Macrococcus animalis TaxID=3395467 RepID=UPI0039BECA9B
MITFSKYFKFESYKFLHSKTILFITIISLLMPIGTVFFSYLASLNDLQINNPSLYQKINNFGVKNDIKSINNLLLMIYSIGGYISLGFLSIWLFSSEFKDKTFNTIYCLPLKFEKIIYAKFLLLICYTFILSILLFSIVNLFAFISGYKMNQVNIMHLFIKIINVNVTLLLLLLPVILITCFTKDNLMPLGFIFITIIFSQVASSLGLSEYFPWTYPSIFSGLVPYDKLNVISFISITGLSLLSYFYLTQWWKGYNL